MQQEEWLQAAALGALFDATTITYEFVGDTALALQGVAVPAPLAALTVDVQWDHLAQAHARLADAGPLEPYAGGTQFQALFGGIPVLVRGPKGVVIAADPERVAVERAGQRVYAKTLGYYRRHLPADDPRQAAITAAFAAAQQAHSQAAAAAWSQSAYDAWVHRYGTPAAHAARIARDPAGRLGTLRPYLGELAGKRVANLLGSHGGKAVALALLGADVTVVDISPSNAAYAQDLAAAAGVSVRYVTVDVLALPAAARTGDYDLVLMEIGILHYFLDLQPLLQVIGDLLRPGGRLVLQDFHPVSTKLLTSTGKKHKVTGNYFDPGLSVSDVAFGKYLPLAEQADIQVRHRRWTLGEVVTAVAEGGLRLLRLDEEPNTKLDDVGIPKTFTLVAQK